MGHVYYARPKFKLSHPTIPMLSQLLGPTPNAMVRTYAEDLDDWKAICLEMDQAERAALQAYAPTRGQGEPQSRRA